MILYTHTHGYFYGQEIKLIKLVDLTNRIYSGSNSDRNSDGNYPVYGSKGIIGKTNDYKYENEQILIARVGAYAGAVQIAKGKYDVTDNTLIIDLKLDKVNIKFLYYYLLRANLNQYARGGGQPLITGKQLKEIVIPVPSLDVQEKIVNILDKFDKLTNDISEGLPAEIEARQKQYEYYRNKLLSFKKLKTA